MNENIDFFHWIRLMYNAKELSFLIKNLDMGKLKLLIKYMFEYNNIKCEPIIVFNDILLVKSAIFTDLVFFIDNACISINIYGTSGDYYEFLKITPYNFDINFDIYRSPLKETKNFIVNNFKKYRSVLKYILIKRRLFDICIYYVNENIELFKKDRLLSLPFDIRKYYIK